MKLQMTPKFPALVVASGNGIALTVANGVYTFTGADSTFAATDTLSQYNFGYESGEGATRMAQRIFRSAMPGAHGGSAHFCFGIEARPVGSLGNGNINADIALGVSNLKHNWQSQSLAQAGEIDGIWISVKQGGPSASNSDCGALLFDVASIADSGYSVGLEGEISQLDASQALVRQIGVTICSIDGKTGTMEGFNASVNAGVALYGFEAVANGGSFTYPFSYVTLTGGLRWAVNGDGSQFMFPVDGTDTHFITIKNNKDVSHPVGSFTLYDSAGIPFFDVLASGPIVAHGNITVSASSPALLFAPSSGATKTGSINQVGDVLAISAASIGDKLRIDLNSGVVTLLTDRTLRFDNHTSGAAAQTGTLTNAPAAGNPGHWLKINIGGTNYCLPAWAG